jgi:hypothetical protein
MKKGATYKSPSDFEFNVSVPRVRLATAYMERGCRFGVLDGNVYISFPAGLIQLDKDRASGSVDYLEQSSDWSACSLDAPLC